MNTNAHTMNTISSTKRITPERRIKEFIKWVQKSETKFGDKFATLRSGSVTLDELRRFIIRSTRMAAVAAQLVDEKKSSISFQDLYWNVDEEMLIPCSEEDHGLICTTPWLHLRSLSGCTKCSGKYQRTEEDFDEDLEAIHGTSIRRLDPYINQKTSMMMKCEVKENHPPFKKMGSDLLHGLQGCPRCQIERSSETRRWKKEEWITEVQKVHSVGKDDYSNLSLEIVGNILWAHNIRCIKHQLDYRQRAIDHQHGHRCLKCKDDTLSAHFRLPYPELIRRCREVHLEEKFEYDEKEPEDYQNGYSKIPVVCTQTDSDGNIHGTWYPTAHNHNNGSGCPHCAMAGWSKIAVEWLNLLSNKLGICIQHARNGGEYRIPDSRYKADGVLYRQIQSVIFEFQGCHVHGCKDCYSNRNDMDLYGIRTHEENYQNTLKKKAFCQEQGYTYVEMWYCQWQTLCNLPSLLETYIEEMKLLIQISQ